MALAAAVLASPTSAFSWRATFALMTVSSHREITHPLSRAPAVSGEWRPDGGKRRPPRAVPGCPRVPGLRLAVRAVTGTRKRRGPGLRLALCAVTGTRKVPNADLAPV